MFYCHHIKQNLKVQQFFVFSRTTEENSSKALGKLNDPLIVWKAFTSTQDQNKD